MLAFQCLCNMISRRSECNYDVGRHEREYHNTESFKRFVILGVIYCLIISKAWYSMNYISCSFYDPFSNGESTVISTIIFYFPIVFTTCILPEHIISMSMYKRMPSRVHGALEIGICFYILSIWLRREIFANTSKIKM